MAWGTPLRSVLGKLCTRRGARLPKRLGLLPGQGEGQRRCAHLLFPSPRTPQRLSSRSPRAGPVCRRGPGRSGRSWISADWKAAASQSEPGPDPPRCGQRRRVRRLSWTPTRDPLSPLTQARTLKYQPSLPPEHPVGGLHAPSGAPSPPGGGTCVFSRVQSTGRAPRTRGRALKSFVWILRRG